MTFGIRVAIVACVAAAAGVEVRAQGKAVADVVVVVDTSTSMRAPGMDPERTSLLVSKLFADVVPGDLAVVRLLDVGDDRTLIPSRNTGVGVPCSEDPSKRCVEVSAVTDWMADARLKKFGALTRTARGDAAYKQQLDAHLAQRINNSMFHLAFQAARGVFDGHTQSPASRTVIWLSDGTSDSAGTVRQVLDEMKNDGVNVEPVVFGKGDLTLATQAGLTPTRVSTPGQLMKAFAGAFRRVVQAPYQLDGELSTSPAFQMRQRIDEAWIVVYGADTLSGASLDGPAGAVAVDYAHDRHPGAGAYHVAYLTNPPAGQWTVRATGGGPGVAYAVIQRSGVFPTFLDPKTAPLGVPVVLVADVRSADGQPLKGGELPDGLRLQAEVEGRTIDLVDDGTHGDATAGDGRFSGSVTFGVLGDAPVTVRARNDVLDRSVRGTVNVSGFFRSRANGVSVDLGRLRHHSESCRPLLLDAEQQGTFAFELRALQSVPNGHRLEIRTGRGGVLPAGGRPLDLQPGETLEVCLATTRAVSSTASGDPWLELRPAGSQQAGVTIRLRWQVDGMTFWERWGWLIVGVLLLLLLAVIVYGYIKPFRFSKTLALVFVPDRQDLTEQSPQPLAQWRGVGIGWYRDARAFLHPNFRVSGHARGAVASLRAAAGSTRVKAENGQTLYRENMDGEWEPIAPEGRSIRPGEPYRVGDQGPYFSTSVRRA